MLQLYWLGEVNPSRNYFVATMNLVSEWVDSRLQWNLTDYPYDRIQVEESLIWSPNFKFFGNNAISKKVGDEIATIFNDGRVMANHPLVYKGYCIVQDRIAKINGELYG